MVYWVFPLLVFRFDNRIVLPSLVSRWVVLRSPSIWSEEPSSLSYEPNIPFIWSSGPFNPVIGSFAPSSWSLEPIVLSSSSCKKCITVYVYIYVYEYTYSKNLNQCRFFPLIICYVFWSVFYISITTVNYPKKNSFSCCRKSRHCAYIIYRVKTCFFLRQVIFC